MDSKKQANQEQTHRYREQVDDHQVGGGWEDEVEKMKGIKKYEVASYKNGCGGEKHSIWKTVSDIAVMYVT